MTWAWMLEFGLELIAHNAVERTIGHVQGKFLVQPGLDSPIAGEAGRSRESRLELHQDGGW
jgi:hypothetical protein